jgi:mRNA-degrading endonuclease RelE of RelBE toxin-antitoxin system
MSGRSRYRVADWRVLFRIDDLAQQVLVLLIAHRSEMYE